MSDSGVDESEMSRFRRISDQDAEQIIAGSGDDPALAEFVAMLRETGTGPVADDLVARHVAAAAEAARLVPETAPIAGETGTATPLPRLKRRTVFTALTTSIMAKVMAGAVALAAVGGGAAVTGNLPDPIQEAVAGAASHIGIDLPDPGEQARTQQQSGTASEAGIRSLERIRTFTGEVRAAVDEHRTAVADWSACVADAEKSATPGDGFDPEAVCGPRPEAKFEFAGPNADQGQHGPNTPADQGQNGPNSPNESGQNGPNAPDAPGTNAPDEPGSGTPSGNADTNTEQNEFGAPSQNQNSGDSNQNGDPAQNQNAASEQNGNGGK
jgi:hypothetical protein